MRDSKKKLPGIYLSLLGHRKQRKIFTNFSNQRCLRCLRSINDFVAAESITTNLVNRALKTQKRGYQLVDGPASKKNRKLITK